MNSNNRYLCEPNIISDFSDLGVCVSLVCLGEVYSNNLFSEEGLLDQVSRCCSY